MKSLLFEPLYAEMQPTNVYALYALQNVGKTVFSMTEAAYQASLGVRTLWIDTEGGLNPETGAVDSLWNTWKPRLEKRFGLKDLNEFVEYHYAIDYEELMKWLGYPVRVEYGENKVTVHPLGKTMGKMAREETVYGSFGRKRGNCMVVIDSLSSPFRQEFGATVQNFSGRADATAYTLHALNLLIRQVNAPLITTNHASMNPTSPYQSVQQTNIRGGATVAYYSKSMAYLEKPKKNVLSAYRKMWRVRGPGGEPWKGQTWMRIDGELGFVFSSEEEVAATLNAALAAKKGTEEAAPEG